MKLECVGKESHEKKKSLKTFKQNAKGGSESLEEESALQMEAGLQFASGVPALYVLLQRKGQLAGDLYHQRNIHKKRMDTGTIQTGKKWKSHFLSFKRRRSPFFKRRKAFIFPDPGRRNTAKTH